MKTKNFGKPLSRLITMVAICMISLNAMAYHFSYTYQGKTLYYNITSSNTVAVTVYSSDNYFENNNHVSGDVVIPSSVTNNGTTYSVTSIGNMAFYYCSSLTSVNIPDGVTSIGDEAFRYCSSLTSVTIPNSVTSIGYAAFVFCSSLTSVTIPNSVTSIGNSAFSHCSSLTSVTIPNSVTSIGEWVFGHCSSLTSITIPNSVTSIGWCAFSGCSSLTSITIPNSVTSIGEAAFYDCSSLTSVTIPNSVTSIGYRAFDGCSSLTTLNFNAVDCSDFTYNPYDYQEKPPFYSCPISTISIGDSVQRIPAYFAYDNDSLTSVTIPNSVNSIGNYAFYDCYRVRVTCLASNPPTLGSIVFFSSSAIITIPMANFASYASSDWNNYNITFEHNGLSYRFTENNTVAVYRYDETVTSVVIPSSIQCNSTTYSVTSIGNSAFRYCSSLTSVTIPNSVTSIGEYAFSDCSGLTSVTIGNSVTSIGESAFAWCSSLTSVTIPNSVTSIADYAFAWCSSLTSVTIPNSVTSIGNYAFSHCSSLTSVTLPNSVTSIGDRAFYNCSSLTSITIPNSVTSIGNSAFGYCSSLTALNFNAVNCSDFTNPFYSCPITTINIGNSVQRIPANFAKGCNNLTSITIPNSVTSIGNSAFYGCNNLTSIVSNAVIPPAIGNTETFPYPNFCIVTIPCGILEAYTAPVCYWSVFFPNRITEEDMRFDLSVAANDDSFGSVSVETQSCNVKTLTATPSNCKSFAAWNDGNTDNPRTVTITSDTSFTAIFENVELSHNITAAICEGTVYTENGFNVSEAGVYTQNLQTINGCDSTVTLTLTVNPVATTTLQAAICEGTVYAENGFNVSEAGVYTQNLQTINGCDSTVTLTLTVNPVATTNLTAAICEGTTYTENGFNVSEAGVYTQNLQTINGCDSTVTLTLTINPVEITNLTAAICEGSTYTENNFNVSEAGVYTQNLQTINGCDSTVTLTLVVNPVATTNLTAAICEGTVYTENGFNVSEAGVYTQNLQTINGCDSTVTLTLVVNPVATTNLTAAICEGIVYTENGFNVSEAGVYTQNLQTINGCDSTVTLTLTVNPVATTTLQAAICEGSVYTDNGFNVSEAGVYTQNLQTINGCDSTVTLTLSVNPVATTTLQAAICEGSTYTENGFNVSEAGVYTQNLQTINGCDSTVTLTLTVNPVATTNLTAAICEGTAYTENGFNVSEAGVYTQNLQTINGCDSTVTLTLTVNPVYNITIDATINQGDVYQENGFEVSEAGTYTQNLQSINGCDSVIVLNLTVNSSLGDVSLNTIEVALYPNPAESYTVLKVQGLKEQTKVALFDVRGRKLREFDLSAGTESIRLDLRDLPSGVYTLIIGNTTKKLIVE